MSYAMIPSPVNHLWAHWY